VVFRTASNDTATVRAKLGFRCSNLSKSAARAAVFIGIFDP
jgi:hypothetical protein